MSYANMLDAQNFKISQMLGRVVTGGRTIYVSSVAGTANAKAVEARSPVSTIAGAVSLATASKADEIILASDHAETITSAGGITLSKAGLILRGQGAGSNRTTITFGTSTAATFAISADNCFISGIRFVCNIDSLVKMIDVSANNITFEDCEFVSSSTKEVLSFINIATTYDNVKLRRCTFHQPTDPAGTDGGANTGGIYCVDTERVLVEDCVFDGFFETACLHNKTTAMKYLTWRNNTVNQQLNTACRILTPVGCVGMSFGPDTDWVPGLGYPAKRATATPPATTTTAYFAINGGDVLIRDLVGMVTTVIQTQACNTKWQVNPTATGSSVDICAVLDISADVVGSFYGITGTAADAMLNGQSIVGQVTPVRAPPGGLDLVTAATNTGSIKWALHWQPADYSLGVPNVIAV